MYQFKYCIDLSQNISFGKSGVDSTWVLTALSAGLVILGESFESLVDFSQEGSVQSELSAGHFALGFGLGVHLLHQVVSIVLVDFVYSLLKSLLLLVVVLLVQLPHLGLLVDVGFVALFSLGLLEHLLGQVLSHLLLLLSLSLGSFFFKLSLSHFSLIFISAQHLVLVLLLFLHFRKDVVGHFVHELLSAGLSLLHFILSILLLFLKHAGVVLLSLQVFLSLPLFLLLLPLLVVLVFYEHLLKVLLLLLSLFYLHLSFIFHLLPQPVNILNFLVQLFFVLLPLSAFVLLHLLVSASFVIHNLIFNGVGFLLFSLLKQLGVLLGHFVVGSVLIALIILLCFLRVYLFVELFSDQPLSLGISKHCLFLFFEMQKSVELLDGCPLVILVDLAVHLGWRLLRPTQVRLRATPGFGVPL